MQTILIFFEYNYQGIKTNKMIRKGSGNEVRDIFTLRIKMLFEAKE